MRRDVFVYISGPMTAKHGRSIEQNISDGLDIYWRLLQKGIPAFCPHLSGAFPTAWTAVEYDAWIDYDKRVIDRCTHVLMMPRWELSTGAMIERDYALLIGKPVAHTEDELFSMLAEVTV